MISYTFGLKCLNEYCFPFLDVITICVVNSPRKTPQVVCFTRFGMLSMISPILFPKDAIGVTSRVVLSRDQRRICSPSSRAV